MTTTSVDSADCRPGRSRRRRPFFTYVATLVGLEEFGILMDGGLNQTAGGQARVISAAGSQVAVLVVPTDEELEIARQSIEVVRR